MARRLGAQRTLAKPTSREELLQAVDAVLAVRVRMPPGAMVEYRLAA